MRFEPSAGKRGWSLRMAAALAVGAVLAAAGCGDDDDSPAAESEAPAHFGYSGADGPSHWASLDPAYELCGSGREQSPIDLESATPGRAPKLAVSYEAGEAEAVNNGHSVETVVAPGSSVRIGGESFELDQFHYHAPSEHLVAGEQLPLEFHFVNRSEDGGAIVLGVLVEAGRENPAFASLTEALPAAEGESAAVEVDPAALLPPNPDRAKRWVYDGSLTTPPCTEGIGWNVFERPIELSPGQIAAYTDVYDHTDRPLQPRDGRELTLAR